MQIFKLALLALVIIGIGVPSGQASAHQVKSEGSISAFVHVLPYDQPKAGQPTNLHIAFTDRANKFDLADCDCHVSLKKNEEVRAQYPIKPSLPGATLTGSVDVVFPDSGDYEISVDGSSAAGKFAKFDLEYPIKVTSATPAVTQSSSKFKLLPMLAIPGLLISAISIKYWMY